jgi:hypothetical protein
VCGVKSDFFLTAVNGVKQVNTVLSPALFCMYIDDLLELLCDIDFGCYIGTQFVGALANTDMI